MEYHVSREVGVAIGGTSSQQGQDFHDKVLKNLKKGADFFLQLKAWGPTNFGVNLNILVKGSRC